MTQPTPHQEELARQFVDAALEVHRELGPGYDELIYGFFDGFSGVTGKESF